MLQLILCGTVLGVPKFICLVFLLGCLGSAARLLAQGETTSAIVGVVVDPTGAAIAGATVTAVSTETGWKRSAKTDDAGRFNFPQLKPGSYSVAVESEGFQPQTNHSVVSSLGQKQTVNFTLELVATRAEITVTGTAPLVNPENPNTSTCLSYTSDAADE